MLMASLPGTPSPHKAAGVGGNKMRHWEAMGQGGAHGPAVQSLRGRVGAGVPEAHLALRLHLPQHCDGALLLLDQVRQLRHAGLAPLLRDGGMAVGGGGGGMT